MPQSSKERHSLFDLMRQHAPVYYDAPSKTFILSRMADARAWLADPNQWKDADRAEEGALVRQFKPADMNRPGDRDSGIGWMDDPDHTRVRRPIQAALVRRIAGSKGAIETIVREQLDRLPAGGFDLMADYAVPIPIRVIGHVLGVDIADFDQFRAWSEAALSVFSREPPAEQVMAREAAVEAICDLLDAMMAERRVRPRDDLVSDLLAEQAATGALSDSEIRINGLNLLLGGNVTTADLIGNGLNLLLRSPDELAKLRADPGLIGTAVEEVLRFEPPVEGAQRVASKDLWLHGCPIRAHQVAAVMTPAANRDPAVFTDPHRFHVARREGPHISFGAGAHICIGAPLARLEARTATWGLVERYPALRLADPDAKPVWREEQTFHGLAHLLVRT
jgi:cytochrome P450